MLNYPTLIEVCGQEDRGDNTSCLYRADYRQGSTLAQDELQMHWDPLFISSGAEELDAAFTPEGAVSFSWSRRRPRQLYLLEREGETPRRVLDQLVRMARYAPDGRTIAFLSPDELSGHFWEWGLWLCDSEGGQIRRIDTPVPVRHLEFSADGQRLWLSVWSYREHTVRGLYLYDLATGQLTREAAGYYSEFSPSPDGRYLAFVGGRGEQCLGLYEIASGRERILRWVSQETVGMGESDLLAPQFSPDGGRIFYSVHHYGGQWSLSQLCATVPEGTAKRVLWEEEAPARVVVPAVLAPAPRELELVGAGRMMRKLP